MSKNKTKTALLLGAYGQTNLGDDLLLYNYLSFLQDRGYNKAFVNASEASLVPAIIKDTFPDIEIFETYRTSPLTLLRLAHRADAIFYGGGTVYKELYATTGRAPYAVVAISMGFNVAAWLMGKRVYGLHIGIGSLKTRLGKFFSRWALRAATKTIFRDATSYTFARDVLHVSEKRIGHSTDGLFLNKRWQRPWHKCTLPAKTAASPVIGVNVLSDIPDWVDKQAYIKTMRQFITELLEAGNTVVLIPFQTGFNPTNDLWFINEEIIPHIKKYDNYILLEDLGIETITSCLQQLDLLVGMRLHSLLLATVASTPFVAVCYDTKCWRFVSEANYPHAIKLEDLSAEKLSQLYTQALKQKAHTKKQLATLAAKNYKEMERCLDEMHM